MSQVLPLNFPIPQEQALANYDYFDISEGTGVKAFYLFTSGNGGTTDYHLTTDSGIYSNDISTTEGSSSTTEYDFDLAEFNLPKRVTGTAYFYFAAGITGGNVYITLKKYDGSTETNICSKTSIFDGTSSTSGTEQKLLKLDLTTTHFKKGDILRATVELAAPGGSASVIFYHDPAGRSSTSDWSSSSAILLPFELDL